MRRAFEHPWAPALGWGILGVVYMLAQPATADMAAHSYRAWLFTHEGLTVWNAQWYGGHHVLGDSLAFAPVSVWARAAGGGGRAARAPAAPPPWRFALGVVCNLFIGRMPFTLGIALAVAAWAAAERPGPAWRAGAA